MNKNKFFLVLASVLCYGSLSAQDYNVLYTPGCTVEGGTTMSVLGGEYTFVSNSTAAFAFGLGDVIESDYSFTFGECVANQNSDFSFVTGNNMGVYFSVGAVLMGSESVMDTSNYAVAFGTDSQISNASKSISIGNGILNYTPNSVIVGNYNAVVTDAVFVVGNGLNNASRSNALVIKKNGEATFSGKVTATSFESSTGTICVNGTLTVGGAIIMEAQGDISMGDFR
jgi:hypothetical protein